MAAPSHVSNKIHTKTGSFVGSNQSTTYAETVTTTATISSGNTMVLIITATAAGNTQTLHMPTSTNNGFLSSWTNVGSVTNAAGGYDYVSINDSGAQANDDVYVWAFTKEATSSAAFSETIDLTQTSGTSFSFNGRFFFEVQEWSDLDSVEFLDSFGKVNNGDSFSYTETASFDADDLLVLCHYNDDDDGGDDSTVVVQATTTGVVKLHATAGGVGSVRSEVYYKVLTGATSNTAITYDDNDTSSPDSTGFGKSLNVFRYVQATAPATTTYNITSSNVTNTIGLSYPNLTKEFQFYPAPSFGNSDTFNTVSVRIDRATGDVNGFSGGFWNSRATYFQKVGGTTPTLKSFTYTNDTSSAAVVDVWISQTGIRQAPPIDSDDVIQGYDFSTDGFVDDSITVTSFIDLNTVTASGTYSGEDTTMTLDGATVKSLENGSSAKVPFSSVYAADSDNDCTIFLQLGNVPASGIAFPIAENNSSTADTPDYYAISPSGASVKTSAETVSGSTGWGTNQLRVVHIEKGSVIERVNGTATTLSGSITADFKMEALYQADASTTTNSSTGLQIVEMYIVDYAMDDAAGKDLETMEAYFAQKYGLEANYPAGHLCQTAQSYTAYDHSPSSILSAQVFGNWGGSISQQIDTPVIITLGKVVGVHPSNSTTIELDWT